MDTGSWISRTCPQCASSKTLQTVLANAIALTCRTCGFDWAVKRMPSDAEAVAIRKGPRQAGALHG